MRSTSLQSFRTGRCGEGHVSHVTFAAVLVGRGRRCRPWGSQGVSRAGMAFSALSGGREAGMALRAKIMGTEKLNSAVVTSSRGGAHSAAVLGTLLQN